MNNNPKMFAIILIIISGLKFFQMENTEGKNEKLEDEASNELLQEMLALKGVNLQLETEINKLNKGLDQQAEIIYHIERNDLAENPASKTQTNRCEANQQEVLRVYKQKLLTLEENFQSCFQLFNSFVENTTNLIVIENCLEQNSSTSMNVEVLQHLQPQIDRLDLLQTKLNNAREHNKVLVTSYEKLSQMMTDVSSVLDKQSEDFEFLEKQLSIMQDSSSILDDFIIRRNQHLDDHYKCENVNCQHGANCFGK